MSIVISVLIKGSVFIASDKRICHINGTVLSDNFKKIFQLNESKLGYIGITGDTKKGLKLIEDIKSSYKSNNNLLKISDELFKQSKITNTVNIIGINNSNQFFIWQKNNSGESTLQIEPIDEDKVFFSIGSTDNIDLFNAYFTKNIKETGDIIESIKKTIYEASLIDNSISAMCDIFFLENKPKQTYTS